MKRQRHALVMEGKRLCDPGSVYALGGEVKSGQRVCLGHIVKDCDSWLRVMDLFL